MPLGMPDTTDSAFDGKFCYFVTTEGLLAVDRAGKLKWVYKPTYWNPKSDWKVFASLGKIALYDGKRKVTWIDPALAKKNGRQVKLPLGEQAEFALRN